jgi:hypothetical protein
MKWIKRIYGYFFAPQCECSLGHPEFPGWWTITVRECPVHGDAALQEKL